MAARLYRGGMEDADISHRKVVEVVRNDRGPVDPGRAGDECVPKVNRLPSSRPLGLVAPASDRCFARGFEVFQACEEVVCSLPFAGTYPSFDFCDGDTSDGQVVAEAEDPVKEAPRRLVASEERYENAGIQDVAGQPRLPPRRPARTQLAVVRSSFQCS